MVRSLPLLLLAACLTPPTDAEEALLDRLRGWRDTHGLQRSALLVNRCGRPWMRERQRVGGRHRFAVASASKWVTAGVFSALHEDGRFDLDQPVSTWLPDLPRPASRATVRQILGHTAGFPSNHDCIGDPGMGLRTCAQLVAASPGVEPGTRFRYGNAGWVVAGAAAEAATGESMDTLLGQTLGGPLGWPGARYGTDENAHNPGIAGDLRISADAYLDWLQLLVDGGARGGEAVVSETSMEALWDGPALPRAGFVPPALRSTPGSVYGLGAWIDARRPDGTVAVASAAGKFGFQPWIDLERRIAGILAVELHGPGSRARRPRSAEVREAVAEAADSLPPCD